jgi:hypothetical protein
MEMNDIELVAALAQLIQHNHVVGQEVLATRACAQRLGTR